MCIPASTADDAAINPKGINTLFADGLITFFIKGNPVFNKGPSNLPKKVLLSIIIHVVNYYH